MICYGDPKRDMPYKLYEIRHHKQDEGERITTYFGEDGSIIGKAEFQGSECINGRWLWRCNGDNPWVIRHERNYRNREYHGVFNFYPGLSEEEPEGKETWYFDGSNLGEGKDGETAFRAREAAETLDKKN